MAITYTLIASNTLIANSATVIFSGIPNTYNDLLLRWTARNDSTQRVVYVTFNGVGGTSYSNTLLYSDGATATSTQITSTAYSFVTAGMSPTTTISTFGSAELYLPTYNSTNKKPVTIFGFSEANNSTAYATSTASLVNITSAITSITLTSGTGQFVTDSTFWLYGIKNS